MVLGLNSAGNSRVDWRPELPEWRKDNRSGRDVLDHQSVRANVSALADLDSAVDATPSAQLDAPADPGHVEPRFITGAPQGHGLDDLAVAFDDHPVSDCDCCVVAEEDPAADDGLPVDRQSVEVPYQQ